MPSHISLTMMSGPRDGETFDFEIKPSGGETLISIGRRENCDLCLNYDSQVSRLHANLIFDGRHFWLEDLDSRNGTFFNKERIEGRIPIKPGVLFRIGRTWMRLDFLPPDDTQAFDPHLNEDDIPF